MNLKPLGDRVVVEREEAKATTAGGIVLPDTAKDKPQKGKVLAVGDGRITKDGKKRELQVKVGDSVLFTSYAGEEFKILGDAEGPPDARRRHPRRDRLIDRSIAVLEYLPNESNHSHTEPHAYGREDDRV